MLKFLVLEDGRPVSNWPLRNAHLLGADDVGVRATISFDGEGLIMCDKRSPGPAALALQYPVDGLGHFTMQTCLLPDRDEPYLLSMELARHRLMWLLTKQEDWSMYDLPDDHAAITRGERARQQFIESLNSAHEPAEADRLARQSLSTSVEASEELTMVHADLWLERRRPTFQPGRNIFLGCGVELGQTAEPVRASLLSNFDFVRLPMRWRHLEPEEQNYDWRQLDGWAEWAFRNRLPILAGPLVSFSPDVVPDWLYIWEHDYETIRDLIYEHVERVVSRYRNVVTLWTVVSGVHVNEHFSFAFDQLIDLTRMAVMLARKIQPNARTLVEITHPFGEYYAANSRSIPPIMYAELALQSGIPFDGFGIKLLMGRAGDGQYTRDLMQISNLLDRFNSLGRPLHITAVGVPSQPIDDELAPPPKEAGAPLSGLSTSGYWRKPWSPVVQSKWLGAVYNIALSKPMVESIAWLDLADHPSAELPHAGLIQPDLKPKGALRQVAALHKSIHNGQPNNNARPSSAVNSSSRT